MRGSTLCLSLFAVVLLPLFGQACAQASRDPGVDANISGSGGAGGAAASSSSGAGGQAGPCKPGSQCPCTSADDCVGFADACNQGACINALCGRLPINELAACDDGKFCTENTACHEGVCGQGTPKLCPSSSACLVGACDPVKDACTEVPGNDGGSCIDQDPCTSTGTCAAGVCTPGQLVDCSFLDSACAIGVCDSQLGCVTQPKNDGAVCDDGFYCTVSDVCTAGVCAGVPNTCAPPGDICLIGTCNEQQKTCVSVPGNNGVSCDDGNDCTSGSTCSNGQCLGGVPANDGMMCNDADGCSLGTTCSNGVCGNPGGQIMMCVNGDGCCPAACANNADDDCVDLTGVFAQYPSENRTVYLWKSPPCAPLAQYTTFCQDRGLAWWSPKSQADAQELITFAYNLDMWHTWIQIYQATTTDVNGKVGGFDVVVDSPGCVDGSNSGWTAFRKWGCSFCDPENQMLQSCCWDIDHQYDWLVCEG